MNNFKNEYLSKLPHYVVDIDDDEALGIYRLSLVESPAVDSNFLALSKPEELIKFSSDEKQEVFGVICRADYPIYRNDNGYEYIVSFPAEQIKKMSQKWIKDLKINNIDTNHNEEEIAGVELIELFIKDTSNGMSPVGFEDIKDGSLFARYKIINADVWARVKNGELKGFSIEGLFDYKTPEELAKEQEQKEWSEIYEMLKNIPNI